MEGSKPIDKTLCLQWDMVCAILNPKGRCAQEVRKNVLGEDKYGESRQRTKVENGRL